MNPQQKVIVQIYDTEQQAIAAIEELLEQGFHKEDISVIGKNLHEIHKVTEETGAVAEVADSPDDPNVPNAAFTGGTIGGVAGLLVGLGALTIPGIGPIIAAGPIAGTLLGAITGADFAMLYKALKAYGVPEDSEEYYSNAIKEGKILVIARQNGSGPDDNHQEAGTASPAGNLL